MSKKINVFIGAAIAILAAAYIGVDVKDKNLNIMPTAHVEAGGVQNSSKTITQQKNNSVDDTDKIADAFDSKKGDMQVQATGTVIAILRDDNEGSRHQKFILELTNGQTLLVAHNIDLAPRIDSIKKGDRVEFYGEYEYSEKGGVIHWTHHDPAGQHIAGWLKHDGKTYQ
jgi:hypothetical protein